MSTSIRTVVITGAGGGLGAAFARAFAAAGDRVIVADIDGDAAARVAAEITASAPVPALAVRVDVTDRASTDALARAAVEAGGSVDVLVNNAAVYAAVTRSSFEDIDEGEWDRVMAVNLKGPWQVTRALSPHLADGGRVINISSATVFSGSAQWAHYVASKSGVIGLSRVLAKELGARGITVNAVAPGFTLTEASHGLIENAEQYGVDRGAIRRAIEPEDIVGTVQYLASPASAFVTGQTVVVDGGRQFI
ncbi:NAD(P)-dependent dehydrogenase (short-subunit alcohol dehydrogenase family) [Microbacterium marinum]|uniref:NAD(P)-dependent dehydrogenase (Short-subunit alcohol dehydrogenase family) n=1 Tax=Microbacterium marinum TaxID=421115 RepID=A0A7W7BN56_9MICO|nr:SDR family oxidoreductase [Microbacterium marinum]MBB4665695.1 NAD(P)-dependent dehydrogenase (short-subunit alcohol dehydrogenase family) [Microbacterium marinum]